MENNVYISNVIRRKEGTTVLAMSLYYGVNGGVVSRLILRSLMKVWNWSVRMMEILRSYVIIDDVSQRLRSITLLPEETSVFKPSEVVDADHDEPLT